MKKFQEETHKALSFCGFRYSGGKSFKLLSRYGFDRMVVGLTIVLLASTGGRTFGQNSKEVSGSVSRIGDATHLEFSGLSGWNYEIKRENNNFIHIRVPRLTAKSIAELQTWSDSLVKKVEITRENDSSHDIIKLNLSSLDVESFDYLTDDPSRLIVDIFTTPEEEKLVQQKKPEKAQKKKKSVAKKKQQKKKAANNYKKMEFVRKPAGGELLEVDKNGDKAAKDTDNYPKIGVYDAGDPGYQRFLIKDYEIDEDSIIASQRNFYLQFPMLKMSASQLDMLLKNVPEYVIRPTSSEENKRARLLLVLYKNERDAVFLKAYDFFQKKHNNSMYDEIVSSLAAEVFYRQWEKHNDRNFLDMALAKYDYLIKEYPESQLTERNHLIHGYLNLEQGRSMEALKSFLSYLKNFKSSAERDQVKLAMAEAFLQLNKYKDASETYSKLREDALALKAGVEAEFRKGDVQFASGEHSNAIESYKAALGEFPKFENRYPNVHYNLGESYFWTGQHKKSLEHLVEFLRQHPRHPHGGYALTRIGELLDILGADKSRVMGAYLESHFRFRGSGGAKVARIRMLSQRMKGMSKKEISKTLEEFDEIAKTTDLPKISEFVTLMAADGFHRRREYRKALDYLITYYRLNSTLTKLSVFQKRVLDNLSDLLKSQLSNSEYMKALKTHAEYSSTWLQNSDRIDIPFFLGQAFEMSGLFQDAEQIYRKTEKRLIEINGTDESKERRVTESLPTLPSVRLRLAAVKTHQRQYAKAFEYLKKTNGSEGLTYSEQVSRVLIAAKVSEARGDISQARKLVSELIKTWKNHPKFLLDAQFAHADLSQRQGRYSDALNSIESIENQRKAGQEVSPDLWAKTLELKARTLVEHQRPIAAADTYSEYLKQFEGKRPVASVRFRLGELLLKQGDFERAKTVWDKIDDKESPMYSKLAQEKLEQFKWRSDYRKYIDRIPAMSKSDGRAKK